MDNRQVTSLLSFMADCHEANIISHSKMKPCFMRRLLSQKFPDLTEAQVKHIMRII